MNKKMLFAAALAVVGFVSLTAFAGKTREQQQQEIAMAVQTKLDELRMTKAQECTDKIVLEAQRRFDEHMAALAAAGPAVGKGKTTRPRGPRVDPLPQNQPKTPADAKRDKMEGKPNTEEKRDKMQNAPNTDKKRDKMRKNNEGGGN